MEEGRQCTWSSSQGWWTRSGNDRVPLFSMLFWTVISWGWEKVEIGKGLSNICFVVASNVQLGLTLVYVKVECYIDSWWASGCMLGGRVCVQNWKHSSGISYMLMLPSLPVTQTHLLRPEVYILVPFGCLHILQASQTQNLQNWTHRFPFKTQYKKIKRKEKFWTQSQGLGSRFPR